MVSQDEQSQPEELTEGQLRERYPVSETFNPLGGYDVMRTSRRITAFVVVNSQYGTSLRFYTWRRRSNTAPWKVDYARQDTRGWNFEGMLSGVQGLKQKYNL